MKFFLTLITLLLSLTMMAQYAPPAGEEGSTAIHADSSVFIDWASHCAVERGWINIADTSIGKTTYGDETNGTGKADNGVVSLGDGGMVLLHFDKPVVNGDGWDFAVFENSFSDDFLELAFVEVSSDGENFFRFDAVSNTQTETQIETFGTLDATKIHNLAGKYRLYFGTPFDLDELKDKPELDVNHIVAIRVVDVVGSIDENYATYDSKGNMVNDPWPTAFETGGFDLDAVGVIHNTATSTVIENSNKLEITLYPNPCYNRLSVKGKYNTVTVYDIYGKGLMQKQFDGSQQIDISKLKPGILLVKAEGEHHTSKVIKVLKRK